MPVFEYLCKECENRFETLVLDSEREVSCDKCRSKNLEKLFSTFGFKSDNSIPTASASSSPEPPGCGCTPISCGCSARH